MPRILGEQSSFDSDIPTPVEGDRNYAITIDDSLQKLTNRTKWLKDNPPIGPQGPVGATGAAGAAGAPGADGADGSPGANGAGIDTGYIVSVNSISGAVSLVGNSGIDVITLPNGQIQISLYVPISISSFTGGSSNEIGSTVASATLNWSINKTETSQSINQGIGTVTNGVRTASYSTPMTSNTTFTITASDGTTSGNASTTVAFYNRRWWGTDPLTSLASAQILTLDNNEFSSARSKTFTINGNGEYIYYAYPAAWGTATFTVNGFLNTAWTLTVVSHTNSSGHTENYNVYRSNTIQNGTGIQIAVS